MNYCFTIHNFIHYFSAHSLVHTYIIVSGFMISSLKSLFYLYLIFIQNLSRTFTIP